VEVKRGKEKISKEKSGGQLSEHALEINGPDPLKERRAKKGGHGKPVKSQRRKECLGVGEKGGTDAKKARKR